MGLLVHHVSLIFVLLVKASQAQRGDVEALSPSPRLGICGKPNPTFNSKPELNQIQTEPRFGRPDDVTNSGTWPWMVSLQRNGRFLCGGTLVAEEFVLTDKDCFEGFPSPVDLRELTATVGRLVQNGVNPNEVTLNVTAIRFSNQAGTNAALLKVVKTTINDFFQPVCLDLSGRFLPVGMRCFALGWANVVTGGAPSILREFRPIAVDTCGNIAGDDVCMTGINVKGVKGGGPVVCKIDDSWIQVAILNLKYTASITVDASIGDVPGGPPFMVLQKTSRFRSFLIALTQSFPTAALGPTTRMPRVVVTHPTPMTPAVNPVAVSNANGIHLSLLPALFLFVQLVLSVMQWF